MSSVSDDSSTAHPDTRRKHCLSQCFPPWFAAAPIWHSGEEGCSTVLATNIPHCIRRSIHSSVPPTSDDDCDYEVGNENDLVYLALDMGRGLGVDNKWTNQIDAHLIVACEPLWRVHCADGTLLLELEVHLFVVLSTMNEF
ncbi:hypothetical protein GCK72_023079 [Caenorhabditis remanei]|uniref:Uncharacterized protein n=1 Tax=Caenorhabditis remanei TaxID=31234 RepID=A0A6A5FVR4_CAERE|nr:hypothetical protein GCK72_023079 [Caenorhabditis remanei]KAF1746622.1 hypothetical protein GCK72_023079 [Caenorhabditis remanei]